MLSLQVAVATLRKPFLPLSLRICHYGNWEREIEVEKINAEGLRKTKRRELGNIARARDAEKINARGRRAKEGSRKTKQW